MSNPTGDALAAAAKADDDDYAFRIAVGPHHIKIYADGRITGMPDMMGWKGDSDFYGGLPADWPSAPLVVTNRIPLVVARACEMAIKAKELI